MFFGRGFLSYLLFFRLYAMTNNALVLLSIYTVLYLITLVPTFSENLALVTVAPDFSLIESCLVCAFTQPSVSINMPSIEKTLFTFFVVDVKQVQNFNPQKGYGV